MMQRIHTRATGITIFLISSMGLATGLAGPKSHHGWSMETPDNGVPPTFSYEEHGGPDQQPAFVIQGTPKTEVSGAWTKVMPVQGGQYYRFQALYKMKQAKTPRIRAVPTLAWQDDKGNQVPLSPKAVVNPNMVPSHNKYRAPRVYPRDRGTTDEGWTVVEGTYKAPGKATQAKITLRLRAVPGQMIRWSGIRLHSTSPDHRRVRLATIHYKPQGETAASNRRQVVPLIKKAADKDADLVVLGEVLTSIGVQESVAEPVPDGPSTKFFGRLSGELGLYIVVGIKEQAGQKTYNTSLLTGPDGKLVGKYRKVVPTSSERVAGTEPGMEYPVFDTKIAKIGMMICYDVHFPEVARNLAANGAEIIAMPIWGGNPGLAAARAIENQIYLVTSTYTPQEGWNWMTSAIWGYRGNQLDVADGQGDIAIAEVDLGKEKYWHGKGDFRGQVYRNRPPATQDNPP